MADSRLGKSGENLIAPLPRTLLDTVMIAARAAIFPDGGSIATSRLLHVTRLAGVDNDTGQFPRRDRGRALHFGAGDRLDFEVDLTSDGRHGRHLELPAIAEHDLEARRLVYRELASDRIRQLKPAEGVGHG